MKNRHTTRVSWGGTCPLDTMCLGRQRSQGPSGWDHGGRGVRGTMGRTMETVESGAPWVGPLRQWSQGSLGRITEAESKP